MAHTDPITKSQVRHVDEYDLHAATDPDGNVYFNDFALESQVRHVDEYRHAAAHADESM